MEEKVDVVIAGGGIAGLAAASALHQLGYRIIVLEPAPRMEKRLAGELIHPTGLKAFCEVGLANVLNDARCNPILGVAICTFDRPGAAEHRLVLEQMLSYSDAPVVQEDGLAVDHHFLRNRLYNAVSSLRDVRILVGERLVNIDRTDRHVVTINTRNKQQKISTIQCRLLIGADGASSLTRRLAGIRSRCERLSCMVGYTIKNTELPHAQYAHLFLGGGRPIYAYPFGAGHVRVLFDGPLNATAMELARYCQSLSRILPHPFRVAVQNAIEQQQPQIAVNHFVATPSAVRDRVALVGDAGGCCHPITASGITNCARDSLRLRNVLQSDKKSVQQALKEYDQLRRGSQRVRAALSRDVYDVSCAEMAELEYMQAGLFEYWKHTRNGRALSIALLSTSEERISVLASEWSRVVMYGMSKLIDQRSRKTATSLSSQGLVALRLLRLLFRHAGAVFEGA